MKSLQNLGVDKWTERRIHYCYTRSKKNNSAKRRKPVHKAKAIESSQHQNHVNHTSRG